MFAQGIVDGGVLRFITNSFESLLPGSTPGYQCCRSRLIATSRAIVTPGGRAGDSYRYNKIKKRLRSVQLLDKEIIMLVNSHLVVCHLAGPDQAVKYPTTCLSHDVSFYMQHCHIGSSLRHLLDPVPVATISPAASWRALLV